MEAKEQAKAKASECPVCLDIYVDPRILPACGHTVCFTCVGKLIDVPPSRSSVVCPECRETSRVPKNGFLKNFRLSDVVAEFQAGITCGSCQRSVPKDETFRCESCRLEINNEQIPETVHSLKDPISKADIVNPVRNKICKHVYDRDSLKKYVADNRARRMLCQCPQMACPNKRRLEMSDIEAFPDFFNLPVANARTDSSDIVLCGVCATKHLKANKEHEVIEYGMASKRDVEEAVRDVNAEEPTYLNLTIAGGLNRVSELTRKAKEAAQRCELAAETIRDELVGREDLTRADLDASKRNAIKLKELVLTSQSEVLNAIKDCEKFIEAQIKMCDSSVAANCFVSGGLANKTSDLADEASTSHAAQPSTSSASRTNASCQERAGRKRKMPDESDSSDDEGNDDFYETMARIRRFCEMGIVNIH